MATIVDTLAILTGGGTMHLDNLVGNVAPGYEKVEKVFRFVSDSPYYLVSDLISFLSAFAYTLSL